MEWISVKDKMPQPGRYVACIAKRNPFSRFMPMVARIEKNGWANPITEQYISEVTHWMPLPKAPETKKDEEGITNDERRSNQGACDSESCVSCVISQHDKG